MQPLFHVNELLNLAFDQAAHGNVGPAAHDPGDVLLVGIALDALMRDGTDSDHDGVTDIQELLAGTDPNVKGAQSIEVRQDPTSGCSSAGLGCGWVLLLALWPITRLRR